MGNALNCNTWGLCAKVGGLFYWDVVCYYVVDWGVFKLNENYSLFYWFVSGGVPYNILYGELNTSEFAVGGDIYLC